MEQMSDSEVTIVGQQGRTTSFEVKINGELVFSKLKQGGFPSVEEMIESIKSAQKGESRLITKGEKAGCCIF